MLLCRPWVAHLLTRLPSPAECPARWLSWGVWLFDAPAWSAADSADGAAGCAPVAWIVSCWEMGYEHVGEIMNLDLRNQPGRPEVILTDVNKIRFR